MSALRIGNNYEQEQKVPESLLQTSALPGEVHDVCADSSTGYCMQVFNPVHCASNQAAVFPELHFLL
jgi:hypothetical protein